MTKQKQHKNIRITKEKNMYKIIKKTPLRWQAMNQKKKHIMLF